MNFFDKVQAKSATYRAAILTRYFRVLNRIYPAYFSVSERKRQIHPFGYSFPSELFVDSIPLKDKVWAEVIPGFRETYRFETEQSYFEMYQSARFAFTWKKGGWDCLRHLEIIANGCVPVFRDIDSCPDVTLDNLPKKLLKQVNRDLIPWKDTQEQNERYQELASQILEYSRNHASTEAMGKRFLEIAKLPPHAKILLLTCDPRPNYAREFTFIGLNRVLKESGGICISYPELKFSYEDFPKEDASKLYGRGFGYTRRLQRTHPEELFDWSDEEIRTSLTEKKWDFILFGKIGVDEPSPGSLPDLPFWKEVRQNYYQNQIGFLYGGDHIQDLNDIGSTHTRHLCHHSRFGICFVRELKL